MNQCETINSPSAAGSGHFLEFLEAQEEEIECLHMEQRGKENMASPKRDDGEMPIPARELKRTTRQVFSSATLSSEIRSLSLTGIPDLHNNVTFSPGG